MKKEDFVDGICNNCGNTGLAGEVCLNCGEVLSKIEPDEADTLLSDQEADSSSEVYPLEELDAEELKEEDGTI